MGRQEADLHPVPPTAAETAAKKDKDKEKSASDDAGVRRPDVDEGAWHAVTSTLWGMLGESDWSNTDIEPHADRLCYFDFVRRRGDVARAARGPHVHLPDSRHRIKTHRRPVSSTQSELLVFPFPNRLQLISLDFDVPDVTRRRVRLSTQAPLPPILRRFPHPTPIPLLGGINLGRPPPPSATERSTRRDRVPRGRDGVRYAC